jgi:hypothetical protein
MHDDTPDPVPPIPPLTPCTLADKARWLDELLRDHGPQWVRENWARLEAEWEWIENL